MSKNQTIENFNELNIIGKVVSNPDFFDGFMSFQMFQESTNLSVKVVALDSTPVKMGQLVNVRGKLVFDTDDNQLVCGANVLFSVQGIPQNHAPKPVSFVETSNIETVKLPEPEEDIQVEINVEETDTDTTEAVEEQEVTVEIEEGTPVLSDEEDTSVEDSSAEAIDEVEDLSIEVSLPPLPSEIEKAKASTPDEVKKEDTPKEEPSKKEEPVSSEPEKGGFRLLKVSEQKETAQSQPEVKSPETTPIKEDSKPVSKKEEKPSQEESTNVTNDRSFSINDFNC